MVSQKGPFYLYRAQNVISNRTKLFLILWLTGMTGVISVLALDIEAVVAILPGASMDALPFSPFLIKLVSMVQPMVLIAAAAGIGVGIANKLGLHAPAAEAAAEGAPILAALRPQLLPGLIAGALCGAALILLYILAKPMLPVDFAARAEAFNRVMPVVMRIFYGGLFEEVLVRWGVMTLLIWLAWRLIDKGEGRPRAIFVIAAIFVSALIFGAGHLGVAVALSERLTGATVVFVIAANSLFGIVAGFLYWRRGLESAMIAHLTTHLVFIAAMFLEPR